MDDLSKAGSLGETYYTMNLSPFEAAIVNAMRRLRKEQAFGELVLRFRQGAMTMVAFHRTWIPSSFLEKYLREEPE